MSAHQTVYNKNSLPQMANELFYLLCQGLAAYNLTRQSTALDLENNKNRWSTFSFM